MLLFEFDISWCYFMDKKSTINADKKPASELQNRSTVKATTYPIPVLQQTCNYPSAAFT